MNELPTITVTLLYDAPRDKRGRFRGGDGRYHVSALIECDDYELGDYATASEAAERMNTFIRDRGYEWALDSAQRINAAQRNDATVLVLDATPYDPTWPGRH